MRSLQGTSFAGGPRSVQHALRQRLISRETAARGVAPRILPSRRCKVPCDHDKARYR